MSIYHELLGVPRPQEELEKLAHFEAFKNHHIVELSKARNKEELLDMINWVASKIQNFNP